MAVVLVATAEPAGAGGQATAASPPLPFEELSRRATAARQANQLEKALELYGQALALQPAWKEGWWYLGQAFYELGRFVEARDAFDRLVKLEPEGGPAWALLGLSQFQLRNYEEAFQAIEEARKLGLGSNEQLSLLTHYHGALLLTRRGRFQEARQILLPLAKQSGQHSSVLEALGLCALAMALLPGEVPPEKRDLVLKAGRAAYYTAEHRRQQAQDLFEELTALYPGEPNLRYNYGLFLQWEDTDAALQQFRKELEIQPQHVSARLAMALEYLRRGRLEEALPWAEQAASLNPDSSEAQRILGQLLLEMGRAEPAVNRLERAVRLAPSDPRIRYLLARAYTRAGKEAEAEKQRAEFLRLKGEVK